MTEPPGGKRFRRVEQRPDFTREPSASDRANFLDSLAEIDHALTLAAPPGSEQVARRSLEYYAACMALIRLASLFEDEAYQSFLSPATTTERRAIATMRNIAAHAGYREMDDTLLWRTLTFDVPDLVRRLREAAAELGAVQYPSSPS